MKCQRDLFKKKEFETVKNKMARNAYLSTIKSKKQTKKTRGTKTESWTQHFDGCQMGWG